MRKETISVAVYSDARKSCRCFAYQNATVAAARAGRGRRRDAGCAHQSGGLERD